MIKAVIFDLDDTLYPEIEYVKSGFKAVAKYLEKEYELKEAYDLLYTRFAQDRKNVFDRVLSENNIFSQELLYKLLEIYKNHKPQITLDFSVQQTLLRLKQTYKLGLITDGRPSQQNLKIDALEIRQYFDKIIITDELGGMQYRKPDKTAFELMKAHFDVEYDKIVYIGDNPLKDFEIKRFCPIITIRLISDESLYKNEEYLQGIKADYTIKDISALSEDFVNCLN